MPTVNIRGCEIAYELLAPERLAGSGSPTPFVWGHGLTSSRAREDQLPILDVRRLAADRAVLRYDARGHGESGSLRTAAEGDWAELALDQIALIDQFGFDEVMLGGASMGTATALHAALTLRDRVRKLVLVIPPTGWETRAAQVDLYESMATAVETRGVEVLVAGVQQTPPPDPFVDDEVWTPTRIDALRAADPDRLAAAFRGAGTADMPPLASIATLVAPTLVLAWSGDPGHPVATAHVLGDTMVNAEVVVASTRAELDTWTDRCKEFLGDD